MDAQARSRSRIFLALCTAQLLPAGVARAADDELAAPAAKVEHSAAAGTFLPLTHAAAIDTQRAYGMGIGGYDSARSSGLFEATAEVRVWGPLALRGGAVYTSGDERLRPSFGARVQLLRESASGLDGAVGVFYRPEGLTEPEGEVEAVLSGGTHLGATYLLGNLVYGQDPEARERDGEVRLAALHPFSSSFLLGFDGRVRFDLGSQRGAGKVEPELDALVGPAASLTLGRVALLLHGGASAYRTTADTAYGAFVLAGLGSSF
jgi:hypothetical protein